MVVVTVEVVVVVVVVVVIVVASPGEVVDLITIDDWQILDDVCSDSLFW